MWKENRFGWPLRGMIWFTVAIAGSCAVIACLVPSFFQGSVHAADKIRIAYSARTSSLLFLLAHKKGFLKAEGVDAEVIRMTMVSPTDNGFRLLIEYTKESAKVTRNVSVSEVADLSILREAQRDLGITVK
jgi:hypothetical protein